MKKAQRGMACARGSRVAGGWVVTQLAVPDIWALFIERAKQATQLLHTLLGSPVNQRKCLQVVGCLEAVMM